ncbi:protein kinase [Gemmatimonadota bacterium]
MKTSTSAFTYQVICGYNLVIMKDQQIGHYKILEKLGAGGMGEVWLAEDTRLDRKVALKFLPHFAAQDENEKARFIQEAKAAARLSHANIAQIHEIDEEDGRLYIVMEYVSGGSLRDALDTAKGKSLPLEKVLTWVQQTAEGLAEAHSQGIVHRDIKPDNLMLTEKGQIKITDFGLARLETATRLTASGTTLGTVNYMSPELITGKDVDHRADLFSLGTTFYELLTGQLVFQGADANATYFAILNQVIDPLTRYRKDLPEGIEPVIGKSLERDVNRRYQAAAEIVTDILRIQDQLDYPGFLLQQKAVWALRILKIIPVTGWVVAIILAVLLFAIPASPDVDQISYRYYPFATKSALERYGSWSPSGDHVAYYVQVDGHWQVVYRKIDELDAIKLTDMPGIRPQSYPVWSNEGDRIYFIAAEGLYSVPITGGTPYLHYKETIATFAQHPKETAFLCFAGQEKLIVVRPPDWEPIPYHPVPFDIGAVFTGNTYIRFSPDGETVGVTRGPNSTFYILPWPSSEDTTYQVIKHGLRQPSFDWIDNRNIILSSIYEFGSWLLDTRTSKLSPITVPVVSEEMFSISPDGSQFLHTRQKRDYDLVKIPLSGDRPFHFLDTEHREQSPSLSRDGDIMAYLTNRMGENEIWLRYIPENRERRLVTHELFSPEFDVQGLGSAVVISPDGRHVAFLVGEAQGGRNVWVSSTAEGGRPTRVLPEGFANVYGSFAWSPGSDSLIVGNSGTVVPLGRPSEAKRITTQAIAMPIWSPRGDWIAGCTFRETPGIEWTGEILLVSPDGKRSRSLTSPVMTGANDILLVWSHDGAHLWFVSSVPGQEGLFRIDIESGEYSLVDSHKYNFRYKAGNFYLHGSLTADQCILTTAEDVSSDLYILEGLQLPISRR